MTSIVESTSADTGSLVISGGVGILKDVYVNGTITSEKFRIRNGDNNNNSIVLKTFNDFEGENTITFPRTSGTLITAESIAAGSEGEIQRAAADGSLHATSKVSICKMRTNCLLPGRIVCSRMVHALTL